MGFLDWLKRLFAGSGERQTADSGLYFYIRLRRGGEIVRLRLEPQHELATDYDEGGYVTRKTVVGRRTFQRAEATFRFDPDRRLVACDITDGELASEEDWLAQEQATTRGHAPES